MTPPSDAPRGRKPAGDARPALLAAAGRAFRTRGYGGAGVDGIARDAGVTSGAFYAHFPSKEDAFREAVRAAVERLVAGVRRFRDAAPADGPPWPEALADWYLGEAHRADLPGGCGLAGLAGEVARADPETRAVFARGVAEAAGILAAAPGLAGRPDAEARAWAVLALLAGGVTLSRAAGEGAAGPGARAAEGARAAIAALLRDPP